MKRKNFLLLCATFFAIPLMGSGAESRDESIAMEFLARFVSKDSRVVEMMDAKMQSVFGAATAARTADSLVAQGGRFKKLGEPKIERAGNFVIAIVHGEYARVSLDFRVTIDESGLVAGFFVANVRSLGEWKLPPYAKPGAWKDEEVVVGAPGWPLKGSLSIPSGKEPFPVVLLVQGSGPSDRDEAIGPNKIFGDLAAGLATDGIAVLRYDKRSFVYADAMAKNLSTIDVRQETVDDALAALAFLSKDRRIDTKRIFLVGHSLGAMLGPMIAAESEARDIPLAGLVLLAPNESPLEDIIVEQIKYLAKSALGGESLGEAEIAKIEAAALRVKALAAAPSPDDPAPSLLPLGIPASWWRSIRGYDPLGSARELGIPLLVLHGSRDYQVGPKEAALWKKGLADIRNARVILLDGLNHLMMRGRGPSTPAEYQRSGHVDGRAIGEIAGFILSH